MKLGATEVDATMPGPGLADSAMPDITDGALANTARATPHTATAKAANNALITLFGGRAARVGGKRR